jgi:hypothetical protein
MQYDVTLKRLLRHFAEQTLQQLSGSPIARWLPEELPKVQNLRMDLLGETADGRLVQVELQSTNDSEIPFRMLEYLVAVHRTYGRIPQQVVLYVGREPLRMADRFEWLNGVARFRIIDIRQVDAEPLLASPEPSDNVIGILGRLSNQRHAVRLII